MNEEYVIGGVACLGLGLYITTIQIKKFVAGKQDRLGDFRLLLGGIGFIVGGIILIAKYG